MFDIYCEHVATLRFKTMANSAAAGRSRLTMSFACNDQEVREAQRLRYRVFKEEMGAGIAANNERLDCDRFDAHCEHLLIRDERNDAVVGTYRLLRGEQAEHVGGFYAEPNFSYATLLANATPWSKSVVPAWRPTIAAVRRSGCYGPACYALLSVKVIALS